MDNPYVEYSFSRVVLFDFFHTTQVIYLKKICLYLSFSCYFIFMFQKKLRGPQILSNLLPEEAKKILKSRGFSELELLANWERIVGKKFAKLTVPLRLKIGKSSEKNNGKLIVKVDRSVAFAFEHEREKIIKKINLFFGYEVINKVEIIQASIKVKKTIKINKLESDIKSQSKNYDELKKYPDLRRNFEKIASKILKS